MSAPLLSRLVARYQTATVMSLMGLRSSGMFWMRTDWRLVRLKARLDGLSMPIEGTLVERVGCEPLLPVYVPRWPLPEASSA
jgi:hypothetical protein